MRAADRRRLHELIRLDFYEFVAEHEIEDITETLEETQHFLQALTDRIKELESRTDPGTFYALVIQWQDQPSLGLDVRGPYPSRDAARQAWELVKEAYGDDMPEAVFDVRRLTPPSAT